MKYGCILVDPPWRYGGSDQFQGRGRKGEQQDGHKMGGDTYPTMRAEEIAALPVASLAAVNCVLLFWATWPCLHLAMGVINAWGAEYISGLPWIKIEGEPQRSLFTGEYEYRPQFGIGFWVRSCSEPLLICRRGRPAVPEGNYLGLISENFGHSRKPENVYEYAEQFPGPYLELFARRRRENWTSVGNEIDGKDIREALAELLEVRDA